MNTIKVLNVSRIVDGCTQYVTIDTETGNYSLTLDYNRVTDTDDAMYDALRDAAAKEREAARRHVRRATIYAKAARHWLHRRNRT